LVYGRADSNTVNNELNLKTIDMNPIYRSGSGQPPEITNLDARIANAGGTSSRIEMQPHRLQEAKRRPTTSTEKERENLIRENGYLRQEIAFYQDSRNAMLAFHSQALEVYQVLQGALKDLSEKLAAAEGRLERYWGMSLNGTGNEDVTVI